MPADAPGFRIGRFHNKLGRRLLANAELIFEDCRIPARYLLGNEGEAWGTEGEWGGPQFDWSKTPQGVPPPFGLLGAAANLGTVRSVYEEALEYAKQRVQGGKPIIEHQHVAMKLAEMKMQYEAAHAYLMQSAWSYKTKYEYNPKCGMLVKAFVDHIGVNFVNITRRHHGRLRHDRRRRAVRQAPARRLLLPARLRDHGDGPAQRRADRLATPTRRRLTSLGRTEGWQNRPS